MRSRNGTVPTRPPARLTWDEAELIWRARDVYRVKAFFGGLFLLLLGVEWLGAVMGLGVILGTLLVVCHGLLFWGLWQLVWWIMREVCWSLRRLWKGR